ncbi:MAG: MFS transporter [Myxococcota bacterium]
MALSLLYVAEGLPYGLFAQGIPLLARQQGASLSKVGLTFLVFLPWALKGLWAPWVDTVSVPGMGRRRTWIVGTQAGLVALLLGASTLFGGDVVTILPLVAVINVLSATQDIAVDGYAVSLLNERTRGYGNAIQVCGYKLGSVISGGLLLWVAGRHGWPVACLALAALLALLMPVGLRLREPPDDTPATHEGARVVWRVVARNLSHRPGAWALLGLTLLCKVGESGASAMLKPALVDRGFTTEDVALWVGTAGLVASLVGSALGGVVVTLLSRRNALVVALVLQAAGLLVLWPLLDAPGKALGLGIVVEHLCTGVLTTVLFTFMMDAVDPRFGGTEYTLLASLVVIGTGSASTFSGFVAERTGYAPLFAGAAALTLLMLALVPAAERARAQRKSPGLAGALSA